MAAGLEHLRGGSPCQAGADGHTVAQGFRQRHDIGLDAGGLMGEPGAAAPHAGLDLIDHHQPALPVTQGAYPGQIRCRGNADAAFALDRLQQDRNNAGFFRGEPFQGRQVPKRNADEAIHQRTKTFLGLGVGRGGQGGQGAAVKGALHDHDARQCEPPRAAQAAGQLDGGLVGFGAGIAKKYLVHASELAQSISQFFLQGNAIQIGGVQQGGRLISHGGGHGGMGMA